MHKQYLITLFDNNIYMNGKIKQIQRITKPRTIKDQLREMEVGEQRRYPRENAPSIRGLVRQLREEELAYSVSAKKVDGCCIVTRL